MGGVRELKDDLLEAHNGKEITTRILQFAEDKNLNICSICTLANLTFIKSET